MCCFHLSGIDWCTLRKIFEFNIILRVILSTMKTWESSAKYFTYSVPDKEDNYLPIEKKARAFANLIWYERFWLTFRSFSGREPHPDFWYNFLIGLIELSAYNYLMRAGLYTYIGGWLGLKIVSQWDTWKANRSAINRFFIATAFQLIFCYVCLADWPELPFHN